jgi:hypothetical protein
LVGFRRRKMEDDVKVIFIIEVIWCSIYLILSLFSFISISVRCGQILKNFKFSSLLTFHGVIFFSMNLFSIIPTIIRILFLIQTFYIPADEVLKIYFLKIISTLECFKFYLISIMMISMMYIW